MNYRFDNDFETKEMPHVSTDEFIDTEFYNNHANSEFKTQYDPEVETWKYGEGQYDYLADDPRYGYHSPAAATSSHRKPWVHYFIIDNIKYFVVMIVFYFLFMNRLDTLGIEGVHYLQVRSEVLACYMGLISLLVIKSTWRFFKMR